MIATSLSNSFEAGLSRPREECTMPIESSTEHVLRPGACHIEVRTTQCRQISAARQ